MKTKRILYGFLALSLLACNYVTQMITPPTATPVPTATITPSPTPSPTPTLIAPAYIPSQCDASSPIPTISPEEALQTATESHVKEIPLRLQLRILNGIESIVDDVYVYPDYNGKDWKGIVAKYREQVREGIDTEQFYIDMQLMLNELEDDHSYFISPLEVDASEAELHGESQFVGVGIYSNVDFEKGHLIVISTFPGSPAEYAGIQPHDKITLVDNLPINFENGIRTLGPECTAVLLKVQSPDGTSHDAMLVRTSIEGNVPIDARLVPASDGSRIGYIFIPSFFDETLPPQIEDALREFGDLDGLILDVRMNGGGSSSVAYPIMEFFTHGRVGEFISRKDSEPLNIVANPINNSQTVPLVVMVSEDTVSFGEVFAGIMRDSRGAKITGETSLGNVELLHGYSFDDGSMMWIAAEKFDSAFSDIDWEETGIVPDITAYADWDTFNFETDPSIAAALELLGH